MKHQEAVETKAVERYLLNEMSGEELDRFEEHFFGCPECAADLEAGTVFLANARAVFEEEQAGRAAESRAPWSTWLSGMRLALTFASVSALLLVAFGYQVVVVVPGLKRELARASAPQAYASMFLRAVTRGDDQVLEIAKGSRVIGLQLDLPLGRSFPNYECRLSPESGGPESGRKAVAIPASAPSSAGTPLNVLVPVSDVPPGRYILKLYGKDGAAQPQELAMYRFVVALK